MTETATEIYVTCQDFCGARITLPGPDGHAAGCGAPKKEMKRLDAELKAKRIQATAAAAVEPETPALDVVAEPFVCSCSETFLTWQELGTHQTETGHQGCATDAPPATELADDDALDEEDETTVDGVKANIDHSKPGKGPKVEKVDLSHLWRDPAIELDWFFDAQIAHDNRDMKVKGAAASAACPGKMTVEHEGSRIEIACPHLPIMVEVKSYECDRDHTHTEVIESLCMIHHVLKHGGKKSVAGLGPLFPPES